MIVDDVNNTINANKHNPDFNTDDISDGFHTFGQLYYQRMKLFSVLVNMFPRLSWKTKKHEDGEPCFGGKFFLVTIETPNGPYGYHYEMEYWDLFVCPELERAPHWDGYTEKDVSRLNSLIQILECGSYYGSYYDRVYECDPDKHMTCRKGCGCYQNGGECHQTIYKAYAKEETDE